MKNHAALILFVLAAVGISYSCTKHNSSVQPVFPKNYTTKMAGTKTWHGTSYGSNYSSGTTTSSGGYWTAYSSPVSETITIIIKNDSTILFNSGPLYYDNVDTVNKFMTFWDRAYTYVTYYYIGDSMNYKWTDVGVHTDNHLELRTP